MIDCVANAGDATTIPGLLSMHLLRSKDGTQVTNDMHWSSREAFDQATANNPVIHATRTAIRPYIDGNGPRPHEVIEIKRSL
jgi:heme-degrading monooxygenase HmoA